MEIEGELRAEFALTGVVSSKVLQRLGVSRSQLAALLRGRRVARVRPGWFRAAGAKKWVLDAVRARCVLTGTHALSFYGGWVPHGSPLRYMNLDGRTKPLVGAQLHQRPKVRAADCSYGLAPWPVALKHGFKNLTLPERVAIIDSLRNNNSTRQINSTELQRVLLRMGCTKELLLADSGAESGVESLARVRLVLHGHAVRSQVRLPNGWHIDLVVDGKVALEIDGSTHGEAEQWRRDIQKNQMATAAGYQTLRLSYWDVVERWDEAYELILVCLART